MGVPNLKMNERRSISNIYGLCPQEKDVILGRDGENLVNMSRLRSDSGQTASLNNVSQKSSLSNMSTNSLFNMYNVPGVKGTFLGDDLMEKI